MGGWQKCASTTVRGCMPSDGCVCAPSSHREVQQLTLEYSGCDRWFSSNRWSHWRDHQTRRYHYGCDTPSWNSNARTMNGVGEETWLLYSDVGVGMTRSFLRGMHGYILGAPENECNCLSSHRCLPPPLIQPTCSLQVDDTRIDQLLKCLAWFRRGHGIGEYNNITLFAMIDPGYSQILHRGRLAVSGC